MTQGWQAGGPAAAPAAAPTATNANGVKQRVKIALYQPDIAANVGAILRLGACMDVAVEIIEPCGFPFDMRQIRRVALDYIEHVELNRHVSWAAFVSARQKTNSGRLILLSTQGTARYDKLAYQPGDTLLLGRESAGVPPEVRAAADDCVAVPLAANMRSLNVASACAMVLGEALRQTDLLPGDVNER
jgi:tRNA (cytidine/uridine-2'-O-)-methyltransferase